MPWNCLEEPRNPQKRNISVTFLESCLATLCHNSWGLSTKSKRSHSKWVHIVCASKMFSNNHKYFWRWERNILTASVSCLWLNKICLIFRSNPNITQLNGLKSNSWKRCFQVISMSNRAMGWLWITSHWWRIGFENWTIFVMKHHTMHLQN